VYERLISPKYKDMDYERNNELKECDKYKPWDGGRLKDKLEEIISGDEYNNSLT